MRLTWNSFPFFQGQVWVEHAPLAASAECRDYSWLPTSTGVGWVLWWASEMRRPESEDRL